MKLIIYGLFLWIFFFSSVFLCSFPQVFWAPFFSNFNSFCFSFLCFISWSVIKNRDKDVNTRKNHLQYCLCLHTPFSATERWLGTPSKMKDKSNRQPTRLVPLSRCWESSTCFNISVPGLMLRHRWHVVIIH